MSKSRRAVVAIPVCNEAEWIEKCLIALDQQRYVPPDRVVLLLNNCTDDTAERVRRLAPTLQTPVVMQECVLEGDQANAGHARRLAMQCASEGLQNHDVLLTTDADGRVTPDWLIANMSALEAGAEVICGCAEIDQSDAELIPRHLHEDDARERELCSLLDQISSILDPDPNDPWPRHTEHSGASIAVTVSSWRLVGGIPAVPSSEDRAFIEALRMVDAKIRHDPAAKVIVSGRTEGRAAGGMAETILRRMGKQDDFTDGSLEPAEDRFRRSLLKAQARTLWATKAYDFSKLKEGICLPDETVRRALDSTFFGQAWKILEDSSPLLQRRSVRFVNLSKEIKIASAIRDLAAELQPQLEYQLINSGINREASRKRLIDALH
jgi:GT2 family glycosyltransferase